MKIKSRPEDFLVREELAVTPARHGSHQLFEMTKSNMNTTDATSEIAYAWRLPHHAIAYGGRKDRHALTTQHITVATRQPYGDAEISPKLTLKAVGFLDRPMGPDLITANHFTVTLRDISPNEEALIAAGVSEASKIGFVNYFDDQRFGSFDPDKGFFAEKILKKHDNGALKIYLTQHSTEDDKHERQRKQALWENWGDPAACLSLSRTEFEHTTLTHLKNNPKDFLWPLRHIPREECSPLFTAYQAFLWNEIVRRLIRQDEKINTLTHPGRAGEYIFFRTLTPEQLCRWSNLTVPMPAAKVTFCDESTKKIYDETLADNGLKPPMFNLKRLRQAYFKDTPRAVLIIPKNLAGEGLEDELYPSRRKIILSFALPRGCYATMLIKQFISITP